MSQRVNLYYTTPQTELIRSTAKYTAAIAGFGSGKTITITRRIILTMMEHPGVNQCYLAPTYAAIRDIFYPVIECLLSSMRIVYYINRSGNIVHIPGAGYIFCRSMEKPEMIVGFSCGDVHIDEIDLLPIAKATMVLNKATARARQIYPKGKINQLWFGSTPEGFKFAYQNFKKKPLDDSRLIQMPTESNPYLPDDYVSTLKKLYPANLLQAYLLGQFINLTSGRVWYAFDRKLNGSNQVVKGMELLRVGMDFNVQRGCAAIHVDRENGMHAVDEIVNTYDTPETISILKERYPKNPIIVYPDASGKNRKSQNASETDMQLLHDAGFMVRVNPSNPGVKDRVAAANGLFCNGEGERRYFVNDKSCPHLVEGYECQVYDDNGQPEKGGGKFDDITDSGTYPIAYEFPIVRAGIIKVEVGGA